MDSDKASEIIDSTLSMVVNEHEDAEDGDLLIEWVVVAYVTNPNSDEVGHSYPMFFSKNSIPRHIARGLLHTGLYSLDRDD